VSAAKFKPSQLRELYDVLCDLSEGEQLALANFYLEGEGQKRLIERFALSCQAIAKYPDNSEAFHDRTPAAEERAIGNPPRAAGIEKTEHLQGYLAIRGLQEVRDRPDLGFSYVAREIFALRNTGSGGWRPPRRAMDLLLASSDGLPIVGEVKIADDKPTFFALIQALMYASELSSPAQRARLRENYGEFRPNSALLDDAGPWLDAWVIGHRPKEHGTYREDSFEASRQISSYLMNAPEVSAVIRRIAYIEGIPTGDDLVFEERWSFPDASDQRHPA
jgi:hypothetical protein